MSLSVVVVGSEVISFVVAAAIKVRGYDDGGSTSFELLTFGPSQTPTSCTYFISDHITICVVQILLYIVIPLLFSSVL